VAFLRFVFMVVASAEEVFAVGDRVVGRQSAARGTVIAVDEDGDPEIQFDAGQVNWYRARDFTKVKGDAIVTQDDILAEKAIVREDWYEAAPNDTFLLNTDRASKAYDAAVTECRNNGWGKWRDASFPPDENSWFVMQGADVHGEPRLRPTKWARLSELGCNIVFPPPPHQCPLTNYGKVHQGSLSDMYFVEALQALATRPRVLHSMFVHADPEMGLYAIRMYINGVWTFVLVDDYVPIDEFNKPMCSRSNDPTASWVGILEKAYAKVHHYWERIASGGYVEDALVDLIGGAPNRFTVQAMADDRLFVYLYEMIRDSIFVFRPCVGACVRRGVDFSSKVPYALLRVAEFQGEPYIQLLCGSTEEKLSSAVGYLSERVPANLRMEFPEQEKEGSVWLRMADFVMYFDEGIECRMVQSDARDLFIHGMPPSRHRVPFTPPWFSGPSYIEQWATDKVMYEANAPRFLIVPEVVPCEVTVVFSQGHPRIPRAEDEEGGEIRACAACCQVKVFQRLQGSLEAYAIVTESPWMPTKDAAVSFKAGFRAPFAIAVDVGGGETMEMHGGIFRVHSSELCKVEPFRLGGFPQVAQDGPPAAIPFDLSLSGPIGRPILHDPFEGAFDSAGHGGGVEDPSGKKDYVADRAWQDSKQCSVM